MLRIFEEVLKGSPQIFDAVLHSALRHFQHPRKFRLLDAVDLSAQSGFIGQRHTRILFVRLVLLLPLLQSSVVGKARHSASPSKVPGLCLIGIELGFKTRKMTHHFESEASTAFLRPSISR